MFIVRRLRAANPVFWETSEHPDPLQSIMAAAIVETAGSPNARVTIGDLTGGFLLFAPGKNQHVQWSCMFKIMNLFIY